ncbi:hypothetical protein, partial [Pseudomonas sp. EL_65y_Pfl1_R83]|uniref:hypothetical protein n=1 Tax=Pseudomonas sp. EL_65y_Pfl1_R83 TaxID=3088697 RepID=UPI00403F335C
MAFVSKKQKAVTIDRQKLHGVDEAIALAKAGVALVKGQRVVDPASLGADMVFPAIGAQIENTLVKGLGLELDG